MFPQTTENNKTTSQQPSSYKLDVFLLVGALVIIMQFDPATNANPTGDNIWIACSDGDVARVTELLQSGVDANVLDENGYSPM